MAPPAYLRYATKFSLCIGTIVRRRKKVRRDLFCLGKVFSREEERVGRIIRVSMRFATGM
jgi:hypothetical protein